MDDSGDDIAVAWYPNMWGGDELNTGTSLTPNKWQHLVATFDGTDVKIYLDKTLIGSKAAGTTITGGGDTPYWVGSRWDSQFNADAFFDGRIDEVRIYNRSLTETEINNSYDRGIRHLPSNNSDVGLLAYIPFDTNMLDYSGNGNNGTPTSYTSSGNPIITGRSSKIEFPDKAYLIASEGGLDIIDAQTNKLWQRNTSKHYHQVIAKEGNIYVDDGANMLNYSYKDDDYTGTSTLANKMWGKSTISTYIDSGDVCYDDIDLEEEIATLTCADWITHAPATTAPADANLIYIGNSTGIWKYLKSDGSKLTDTITLTTYNVTSADQQRDLLAIATNAGEITIYNTTANLSIKTYDTELPYDDISEISYWIGSSSHEILVATYQNGAYVLGDIIPNTTIPVVPTFNTTNSTYGIEWMCITW